MLGFRRVRRAFGGEASAVPGLKDRGILTDTMSRHALPQGPIGSRGAGAAPTATRGQDAMSGRVRAHKRAFNAGRWIAVALLAITLALLAGGCGTSEPKGPSPEELARIEAAKRAEEERLRKEAEERRQTQELMEAFGEIGEPPESALPPEERGQPAAPAQPAEAAPGAAPAAPAAAAPAAVAAQGLSVPQGTTPGTITIDLSNTGPTIQGSVAFDDAVPRLPPDPIVRVAVFSASGQRSKARDVSLILGTYLREPLEERIGMGVRIAYVAETTRLPQHVSEVHYRGAKFLQAAQAMAAAISAQQWIGPMTAQEQQQEGVDVVVRLGPAYR